MSTPWRLVAAVLFLWLILFQVTRLYQTGLAYDDAYLATAAKSLAFGHGYATHYPAEQKFDVRLGVGISLQAPAAWLVALFGNHYWVPGLTTVLAADALLIAIGVQLRRRLRLGAWRTVTLGILAMAVVMAYKDEWMLSHWFALLGDVPAALLAVLAVLMLSDDLERRGSPGPLGGLTTGLAIEMKLVTAVGLAPVMVYVLLHSLREGGKGSLKRCAVFVASVMAPLAAVQLVTVAALSGWPRYLDHLRSWRDYMAADYSGSGLIGPSAVLSEGRLFPRLLVNAPIALEYLGGGIFALALFGLAAIVGMRLLHARPASTSPAAKPGVLLLTAALMHAAWWFALSTTGYTNHLAPAFLYFAWALALAATTSAGRTLDVAALVLSLTVIVARLPWLPSYVPSLEQSPVLRAAQEARHVILQQRADGWRHLGCAWWGLRDLEFLLPGVGNFQDCLKLAPGAYRAGRFALVRETLFWNWDQDDRLQAFADACERDVLFRNDFFVISRCAEPPPGGGP